MGTSWAPCSWARDSPPLLKRLEFLPSRRASSIWATSRQARWARRRTPLNMEQIRSCRPPPPSASRQVGPRDKNGKRHNLARVKFHLSMNSSKLTRKSTCPCRSRSKIFHRSNSRYKCRNKHSSWRRQQTSPSQSNKLWKGRRHPTALWLQEMQRRHRARCHSKQVHPVGKISCKESRSQQTPWPCSRWCSSIQTKRELPKFKWERVILSQSPRKETSCFKAKACVTKTGRSSLRTGKLGLDLRWKSVRSRRSSWEPNHQKTV